MHEIRMVANTLNEEFKKAQREPMSTQDFWDRLAKAAIERLDIIRNLKPQETPDEQSPEQRTV